MQLPLREEHGLSSLSGGPAGGRRSLSAAVSAAVIRLLGRQDRAGFWQFDLEADTTIPSEYILLRHFLGDVDAEREQALARYIRRRQLPDGGWPIYHGGAADISATVKAYFALKLAGDDPGTPHMRRAREAVHRMGGAERVNVFTRITLALFGQMPWRTVPAMPVEIMLLPRWFFFHLSKISYWSRTVLVPLLILFARKPVVRLPGGDLRELFLRDPSRLRHLDRFSVKRRWLANLFIAVDRILKRIEPLLPEGTRRHAVERAVEWTRARMRGEGGPGGIFPAMANSVMALSVLGVSREDPDMRRCLRAIDDLLVDWGDEMLCQPCVGPVWDTCLALNALLEAGTSVRTATVSRALNWLFDRQVFTPGDWSELAAGLEPGGWAFQHENDLYPDVDDTSMVLTALLRAGCAEDAGRQPALRAAVNWILGMQNLDGGWGAFDIDNRYIYLNHIPFADHGALLDPSTSDLTARCIELLAMAGYDREFPAVARALEFLKREQEDCGAWFGRWGVNYIYGTWSVLSALRVLGVDMSEGWVRRAVAWLESVQNPDGGWGESCVSYDTPALAGVGGSTASQTAWALLGLMAAGEVESPAVKRGVEFLLSTQNAEGDWDEPFYTGTGFPRVFYLRYHGYRLYFPLWALAVYRRLSSGEPTRQVMMRAAGPAPWLAGLSSRRG